LEKNLSLVFIPMHVLLPPKDFLGASLRLYLCSCLTLIITRNCHVFRFLFSADELMLLDIA